MIQIYLEFLPELLKALRETFILLGFSVLSAILVGLPLGTLIYLTRKDGLFENRIVSFILNGYVDVVRSFPFLLFIVFMIPVTRFLIGTSLGTYAAAVPMCFVAAALYARFVEQALIDVPQGTIDSALSLGATPFQLVFKFLFVEARSGLVLGLTSSIISYVNYSTVMGVVGGGGIGDFAMRYGYQRFEWQIMYATILIMIVLVLIIQFTGNRIAKRIDKR